jgi:predicted enzyme related to lactoylglutathione lyase
MVDEINLGQCVQVEFVSKDPEATRKFFHAAFGIELKKMDLGEMQYWSREGDTMPGTGMRLPMGPEHPTTIPYFWVPSVDAALAKIVKAGGKVMVGKQEVPKMGWFALYEAPGGVVQGIWETAPQPPP